MMGALVILLWVCVGAVLYTYVGYPLLMALLARLKGKGDERGGIAESRQNLMPPISLIIPAYNEEKVIAEKIKNTLELDYPASRLEIVVVSDGSNDSTEEVARRAAEDRVRLVFRENREGKTACINAVLNTLKGEIVVFTDANAYFLPEALKHLVQPFGSPRVGCVMGELSYLKEDSLNASLGEGLYWRYENFIKKQESRLGSTIVGNGAIYAIRRSLCRVLPHKLEADVANPLIALNSGYRVVFEERARAVERAAGTVREEFYRKSRIITNQLTTYFYGWRELRLISSSAFFQIVSHKILRWAVPLFLSVIFLVSALATPGPFYGSLLVAQVVFYLLAIVGWWRERTSRAVSRVVFMPYYFCAVNIAAIRGIFDFLCGRSQVVWEKAESTRRSQDSVSHGPWK